MGINCLQFMNLQMTAEGVHELEMTVNVGS